MLVSSKKRRSSLKKKFRNNLRRMNFTR